MVVVVVAAGADAVAPAGAGEERNGLRTAGGEGEESTRGLYDEEEGETERLEQHGRHVPVEEVARARSGGDGADGARGRRRRGVARVRQRARAEAHGATQR